MLFTHMDQLGFVVRKIEADGLIRVERLGGVPERALAAQAVLLCVGEGRDVPGIIANKSHHATTPEEKYQVLPYARDLHRRRLHGAKAAVEAAGIRIGTPVVYRPQVVRARGRPHRRHLGRRPRRLRRAAGGRRAACAAQRRPDRAPRLVGAGGIQPARRRRRRRRRCSPTSRSRST